jgi:hypothetical protein
MTWLKKELHVCMFFPSASAEKSSPLNHQLEKGRPKKQKINMNKKHEMNNVLYCLIISGPR